MTTSVAALKSEPIPVATLLGMGAPYNPRRIDPAQLLALRRSLAMFGAVEPVVANRRTGRIVGGHQRVKAAEAEGFEALPVVRVDLDETGERQLNLALNKISGEWDEPALAALLEELGASALDLTGFDGAEVDELIARMKREARAVDPDEVPEPPKLAVTKPGDLYVLGKHRLLCGDLTKADDLARLTMGQKADLVFTDPPYGIAYLPQNAALAAKGHLKGDVRDEYGQWDTFTKTLDSWCGVVLETLREGGCYYVCMGWEHLGDVIGSMRGRKCLPYTVITWDRVSPRMTGFPQDYIPVTEFIVYGWRRGCRRGNGGDGPAQTTLWRFNTMRAKEMVHTTQKPTELVANAIANSSYSGELVMDFFAGSGTTLIAAEQLNRRCFGLEIDPIYCDVIVTRWENFTGNKAVLEAPAA